MTRFLKGVGWAGCVSMSTGTVKGIGRKRRRALKRQPSQRAAPQNAPADSWKYTGMVFFDGLKMGRVVREKRRRGDLWEK